MMKLKLSKTAKILIIIVVIVGGSIPAYFLIKNWKQASQVFLSPYQGEYIGNDVIIEVDPFIIASNAIFLNISNVTIGENYDINAYASGTVSQIQILSDNGHTYAYRQFLETTTDDIVADIFGIDQSLTYLDGSPKLFILVVRDDLNDRYAVRPLFKTGGSWYYRTFFQGFESDIVFAATSDIQAYIDFLPEYSDRRLTDPSIKV